MRTNNTPEGLVRMSGKNLGGLALASSCDRCAWLKLRLQNRLPFQVFPGIFSSIDAFSKNVIHAYLDEHGAPPPWLTPLGEVTGYIDPPHWSQFQLVDKEYGVLLTGAADGIFTLRDGSLVIADYKTARYTAGQDVLLPMYEVQLNAYRLIAEHLGLGTVSQLALAYTEPVTDGTPATRLIDRDGFSMPFTVKVVSVALQRDLVPPLLRRVRWLHEMVAPPAGRAGCKDCARVTAMLRCVA